ncbi:molybdopterin-guanine dinucleotide biosynthesis protein MobA [Asticcacaulis excentricus]|uniref:Molybdopterin-guanine dinucleotide biosynthesis protein MobA n=2 Tax=Asticcacaulis excentricus TaxID=78587 RepID=A0A3G9G450_9CAUL|nr:molybdopterin-guanine dinucleotide biosynthesis protein MobA [Asticcacaulis excentricus]
MGVDKAGLMFEGRTWLEIAADTLTAAGATHILYSGRPDLPGGLADPVADSGPAGGVLAALAQVGAEVNQVLCVPVDMPELSPDTLRRLAAHKGIGACFEGQPLPFALRLSPAVLAAAHELVTTAARPPSLRALLRQVGCVELPVPAGLTLRNLNTPQDVAALRSK